MRSLWSQAGEKGDQHWFTCPVRWAEEVELVAVAGGDSWKDELRVCDLSNVQISRVCAVWNRTLIFILAFKDCFPVIVYVALNFL